MIHEIKICNPKIKVLVSTIHKIHYLLSIVFSEELRQILYSISSSMCDIRSNFKVILNILQGMKLSRNSFVRGEKKMGIMNLGCICYINAVLQQLQMIEPFRYGIISVEKVDK